MRRQLRHRQLDEKKNHLKVLYLWLEPQTLERLCCCFHLVCAAARKRLFNVFIHSWHQVDSGIFADVRALSSLTHSFILFQFFFFSVARLLSTDLKWLGILCNAIFVGKQKIEGKKITESVTKYRYNFEHVPLLLLLKFLCHSTAKTITCKTISIRHSTSTTCCRRGCCCCCCYFCSANKSKTIELDADGECAHVLRVWHIILFSRFYCSNESATEHNELCCTRRNLHGTSIQRKNKPDGIFLVAVQDDSDLTTQYDSPITHQLAPAHGRLCGEVLFFSFDLLNRQLSHWLCVLWGNWIDMIAG